MTPSLSPIGRLVLLSALFATVVYCAPVQEDVDEIVPESEKLLSTDWGWVARRRRSSSTTCPTTSVIENGVKFTGKYPGKEVDGYTNINSYVKECKCDCQIPSGWSKVDKLNSGRYHDGNYYVRFSKYGTDEDKSCYCSMVKLIGGQTKVEYDWEKGVGKVPQTVGTCNRHAGKSEEFKPTRCYYKACLVHDICLEKFGHPQCAHLLVKGLVDLGLSLWCSQ